MPSTSQYAKVAWERRFLLQRFPAEVAITRTRHIIDRYLEGTTLRLRQQSDEAETVFKLSQKIPQSTKGVRRDLVTTIYLTEMEFCRFTRLPSKLLQKTRHSVPPFGIDVFEGVLEGLVFAEAEFDSEAEASNLTIAPFLGPEVSDDDRFSGVRLASAARLELEQWLAEYGVELSAPIARSAE